MIQSETCTLLPRLLEQWARAKPEARAVVTADADLTYGEVWERVRVAAAALRRVEVRPMERVVLRLTDESQLLVALFACFTVGAVAVPMAPELSPARRAQIVRDCEPVLVIDDLFDLRGAAACLDPLPDLDPDDLAVLLYTAGVTGPPKGAMQIHGRLCRAAARRSATLGLRETDGVIALAPLSHAVGLAGALLPTLSAGATLILPPMSDPVRTAALIEDRRATLCVGLPRVYAELARLNGQSVVPGNLRRCFSGGAALPEEVAREFQRRFGREIRQECGTAELPGYCLAIGYGGLKPGSVGRPAPGVALRLVREDGEPCGPDEVGEIWARSDVATVGYWNDNAATLSLLHDGWIRTGDLARVDAEGDVFLVGRLDPGAGHAAPPKLPEIGRGRRVRSTPRRPGCRWWR